MKMFSEEIIKKLNEAKASQLAKLTEAEKEETERIFDYICKIIYGLTKDSEKENMKADLDRLKNFDHIEKQAVIRSCASKDFLFEFFKSTHIICKLRGEKSITDRWEENL